MRIMSLPLAVLLVSSPLASLAQDGDATRTFEIDPDSSWIRVMAWPDGPLKRFGHHHVISHHGITGTVQVAENPLESSFEFSLDVAGLEVDNLAERAEVAQALDNEEFDGEVPQKDIDGTVSNMLSEDLLDGENYSTVVVRSQSIEGSLDDATIVTTMTVKDTEMTVSVPATIELTDDGFVARGQFEALHGAFGLSQFTAMGGALSVRDLLVLKFEISGTPAAAE